MLHIWVQVYPQLRVYPRWESWLSRRLLWLQRVLRQGDYQPLGTVSQWVADLHSTNWRSRIFVVLFEIPPCLLERRCLQGRRWWRLNRSLVTFGAFGLRMLGHRDMSGADEQHWFEIHSELYIMRVAWWKVCEIMPWWVPVSQWGWCAMVVLLIETNVSKSLIANWWNQMHKN
jgi:hypothetical protein